MKLHEYQSKELLKRYGIRVPLGRMAHTVEEAVQAVRPLMEGSGNPVVVVKAQIHAGGRGKGRFAEHPDLPGVNVVLEGRAGGIKATEERVRELGKRMLGSTLKTAQTGAEGKQVNRLYIEQGVDIDRELYISVVLDRAAGCNLVMASTEGGTDIEEVAAEAPEKILREFIDPAVGLLPFQAHALSWKLGFRGESYRNGCRLITSLAHAAEGLDSDLIEINPLVVTGTGEVVALDGKVSVDDNALFRHKDLLDLRDLSEGDPAEIEASKYDLSFVKLEGSIGCLVNGAGLAMATMDTIKHVGGEPANFLDVGGGATKERVAEAFKIILSDDNVKAVLVNIFGGIVRCDMIAEGIIGAVEQVGVNVPVVVRLEGNNAELGAKKLAESGLNIIAATSLTDAAQQVVKAAEGK